MSTDKGKQGSKGMSSKSQVRPGSPEESERDLPLKAGMRRLFWSMGCSTKLDVKLRAYVSGEHRGPGWQECTDLDVLAVGFSPGGLPQLTIADCKTTLRGAIERMFWVRGVADFFSASEAYLVRSNAVPPATRSLSARLGVGVLDPEDYRAIVRTFPTELDVDGPLRCLFDGESIQRQTNNIAGLDKKLDNLIEFARFDYWLYEPYRNLTQVVAHLAEAKATLDPKNGRHLSLFFEAAWLYAFALAQATHHIRSTRMADVPTAVRTYVAGGELAMREKGQLAHLLHKVGISADARSIVLPPYIDLLTDLLTRLLVRPIELGDCLRYAEYLAAATVVGEKATVADAFGRSKVRPVAATLLANVCGFLVTAAGLRAEFRVEARERLVVDLTGGVPANRKGSEPSVPVIQVTDASKLPSPPEELTLFRDLAQPSVASPSQSEPKD